MSIHIVFSSPKISYDIVPSNTVLIIGYASDGPVWEPTYINSYEVASSTFGSCDLSEAWYVASEVGAVDIYLMRVNGCASWYQVPYRTQPDIIDSPTDVAFTLYSKNAGVKYNDAISFSVTVASGLADKLIIKNINNTNRTYDLTIYPTLGHLCEAINDDSKIGLVDVCAILNDDLSSASIHTSSLASQPFTMLSNGRDYDSETLAQSLLEGYEDMIFNFPAEVIVLSGAYYAGNENYIKDLASFCYKRNETGMSTIGIVSARPKTDIETVEEYVNSLITSEHKNDLTENDGDSGRFVSVIVGEANIYDGTSTFKTTLAPAIGGLCTLLPSSNSVMNKRLCSGELLYSFSQKEINALTNVGLNPVRNSIRNGPVVNSALTLDKDKSIYKSLTYVRISQKISNDVQEVLSNFIGSIDTGFNSSYIVQKVTTVMSNLVTNNYVREFSINITESTDEKIITITAVPIGEIKSITVTVRV